MWTFIFMTSIYWNCNLEKEGEKNSIANHIFPFIIIVWMSRVQVYLWWHLTRLDLTWLGFIWNSNPINIKLFWFEHSPIYVKMSATFYNPKREENKSVRLTKGAFSTHTKKKTRVFLCLFGQLLLFGFVWNTQISSYSSSSKKKLSL